MSEIYDLEQGMTTLTVGKKESITGVLLHAGSSENGDALDYFAGSKSGNVLEATIPNATQAQAQAILDRLTLRGYQYQPFDSERTVTDPTIEIGDYVTANGNDGIVLGYDINHSRLMAPTLKAPYDEEVNHEFKFETRQQREYRRETAYTRSRLSINADAIVAEVARATKTEGEISARLTVQADEISAKVSKNGGSFSTFGWSLTDSDWSLFSGSATVLRATKDGIEVKGRITATSGYIGTESAGFEIGSRFIRNGMTSLSDTTNNGVYIGTDGISLGGGKFKVDSYGNLTASSGTFTGNVYAGNIKYGTEGGVNYGTMGGGGITAGSIGTDTGSPLSSYAIGGIGGGVNFAAMTQQQYTADWVVANHIVCYTPGNISGNHYGSWADDSGTYLATWKSYTYPTGVSVWTQNNSYEYVYNTDGISKAVLSGIGLYGSLTTGSGKLNYVGR